MSKVYVLQKELPDGARSGDEYKKHGDKYYNVRMSNDPCPVIEHNSYFTWQVEDAPDWFLPKEEKIEVMELYPHDIFERGVDFKKFCYVLATSKKVPQEKYEKVKKTIEAVLNYEKVMIVPFVKGSGWRIDIDVLSDQPPIKTYTEKEVLEKEEDAFYSARKYAPDKNIYYPKPIIEPPLSYPTFKDYINATK